MPLINMLSLAEVLPVYNKCKTVYSNYKLTWQERYNLIFDHIAMDIRLHYYCPDMDYDDDLHAFMLAFDEHIDYLYRIKLDL